MVFLSNLWQNLITLPSEKFHQEKRQKGLIFIVCNMSGVNPHGLMPSEIGTIPVLQRRKMRLSKVNKIVQGPKLLDGRANIPDWLQNTYSVWYTCNWTATLFLQVNLRTAFFLFLFFVLFKNFVFQLENNCFTVLCWFLPYNNANHP